MSWGDDLGGALRASRIAVVLLTKGGNQPFHVNEEIHLAVLYHRQYGTPLIVPVYLGGTTAGPESPYGLYGIQSIVDPNGDIDAIATRLLDRLEGHWADFPAPTTPELQGPQEVIVEPGGGHGTVATIGRALAKAGAGATIRIRPGLSGSERWAFAVGSVTALIGLIGLRRLTADMSEFAPAPSI